MYIRTIRGTYAYFHIARIVCPLYLEVLVSIEYVLRMYVQVGLIVMQSMSRSSLLGRIELGALAALSKYGVLPCLVELILQYLFGT